MVVARMKACNGASGALAPLEFRWEIMTLYRKSGMDPAAYRSGGHLALRYIKYIITLFEFKQEPSYTILYSLINAP